MCMYSMIIKNYSVDVYTKQKKYKFNHFSFLVQWPYYKAAVLYGPQPAARNPQPAARRIVNLKREYQVVFLFLHENVCTH